MPDSSDTSPLLAPSSAAQSSSDNIALSADVAHRFSVYFVVPALFFGAMLASADVAYNIATYAFVGSEFNEVHNASLLLIVHELIHTVVQPIYGNLSIRYGHKHLVLVAYLLFAAGTGICGFADSLTQMIVGRAVLSTGVSGIAVLVTFTLSNMVSLRTFAILQSGHSICETIGLVFGSFIGSRVAKSSGWRLLYRANGVAVCLPFLWLLFVMPGRTSPKSDYPCTLQQSRPRNSVVKFDLLGTALLITAVSSTMLLLESIGGEQEWGTPFIILLGVTTLPSWCLFAFVEIHWHHKALVPLRLLKFPLVGLTVVCNSIIMFTYTMSIYQVSFYLQALQYSRSDSSNAGLSPLYVGLGCGFLIGGIYVRASGKTRAMVTFSAAVTSCSYALLASRRVDVGSRWSGALLACMGGSLAASFEGLIVTLISQSDKSDSILLIGMNSVIVSIFGTLGTKVSAILFHQTIRGKIESKLNDHDLALDVISRVFRNLEQLRSLQPQIREAVEESIRDSYQHLHLYVCLVSIIAAITALSLKTRL